MLNQTSKKFRIKFIYRSLHEGATQKKLPKDCGFTLVELLVVISTIALLLSVLMPALSNARKMAKSVVCSSNLRQIGISFSLYAEDYKGSLPPYAYANSASGYYLDPFWHEVISPYLGNKKGSVGYAGTDKSKKLLTCPELKPGINYLQSYGVSYPSVFAFAMKPGKAIPPLPYEQSIYNGSAKLNKLPSYVWVLADSKTTYFSAKSCQIGNPAWTSNFGLNWDSDKDGVPDTSRSFYGSDIRYNGIDPRHPNKSTCMLFADGSSKRININKWALNDGGMWGKKSPELSAYK